MKAEWIATGIFMAALVAAAVIGANLNQGLGWYIAQLLK